MHGGVEDIEYGAQICANTTVPYTATLQRERRRRGTARIPLTRSLSLCIILSPREKMAAGIDFTVSHRTVVALVLHIHLTSSSLCMVGQLGRQTLIFLMPAPTTNRFDLGWKDDERMTD